VETFIQQQQWWLQLLSEARNIDLAKSRIPVSMVPFIRLKAGDVFRFLVAHQQRHFVQVNHTLPAVKPAPVL